MLYIQAAHRGARASVDVIQMLDKLAEYPRWHNQSEARKEQSQQDDNGKCVAEWIVSGPDALYRRSSCQADGFGLVKIRNIDRIIMN